MSKGRCDWLVGQVRMWAPGKRQGVVVVWVWLEVGVGWAWRVGVVGQ